MSELFAYLARRFRPPFGWFQLALALSAAICPALIAEASALRLPTGLLTWAGLLGLVFGLLFGTGTKRRYRLASAAVLALLGLVFGAVLLVAVGNALPPNALVLRDTAAYLAWLGRAVDRTVAAGELPASETVQFLSVSLPRFWQSVAAAPAAGEAGGRLLVALGGVLATWLGTLVLGWAVRGQRSLFGWGLPLLAAMLGITVLADGSEAMLVVGVALLLLMAILSGFRQYEQGWQHAHSDYSDMLQWDVLGWGSAVVIGMICIALIIPTTVNNPIADLFWKDVELPSGIAVLDRNAAQRPQPVKIALSQLPAVQLGVSLEQQPSQELALRVTVDQPLPASPWPRYWRARVLNVYNGRGWTSNARTGELATATTMDLDLAGTIVQEVEDLRPGHKVLVGLPDVIGMSVDANVERLPDGTRSAMTIDDPPRRYQVLSRPQDEAAQPDPAAPPPDLRDVLALPASLPPRVTELARVIVGERESQYEQALAFEEYLRTLPYAYEVRPLPGSADAVDQFLFDMRHGYCTYYASAMAIMARSVGIPARVAVGYATGTYDEASGTYVVREGDAHAWPELYISGRWLPFEPTPVRPLPARGGTEPSDPVPTPAPLPVPERQPGSLAAGLAVAGVALLALVILAAWRLRPVSPIVRAQQRLERAGARAGAVWSDGETVREYGASLEREAPEARSALRDLVHLIERARYGGRPLRGDELDRLRAAGDQVWMWFGRRPRRR